MPSDSETPAQVATRLTGLAAKGGPAGGALSEVSLDGGTVVLVKRGVGRAAGRAEAAGLRWLAEPGVAHVPPVRGADDDWLVIEAVPTTAPTVEHAEALGRELAALHASGAPEYGSPPPGGPVEAWIGPLPMRNVTGADWPSWYAEQRVLPYLRAVRDDRLVSDAEVELIEAACARLPELAPVPARPARLHGDLWNGNVLWGADGNPWLIDPAAHGGHPETDLAMLHLFGCAQFDRVLAAYREAGWLPDGWQARIGLHQLFPLLVHAIQYGRGYAQQAVDVARAVS